MYVLTEQCLQNGKQKSVLCTQKMPLTLMCLYGQTSSLDFVIFIQCLNICNNKYCVYDWNKRMLIHTRNVLIH